jgi:hypothetical protein
MEGSAEVSGIGFLLKLWGRGLDKRFEGLGYDEVDKGHRMVSLSMYAGALTRIEHPVPALAKGKVVRDLGKVGVGVECLDCGLYLLNLVKG